MDPLSLRDQFAMAALTGLLARGADILCVGKQAYRAADRMLDERSKEQREGPIPG